MDIPLLEEQGQLFFFSFIFSFFTSYTFVLLRFPILFDYIFDIHFFFLSSCFILHSLCIDEYYISSCLPFFFTLFIFYSIKKGQTNYDDNVCMDFLKICFISLIGKKEKGQKMERSNQVNQMIILG